MISGNTGKIVLAFSPLVDQQVAFIDNKGDAYVSKITAISAKLSDDETSVIVNLYNSGGGVIGIETMKDMENLLVIDGSSSTPNAFQFLWKVIHNDAHIEEFKKSLLDSIAKDEKKDDSE